ncbi:MAG: arylesterase [Methylococcaceae bacterium]|nr:arylesterase [Methylococcaceae bacterium]
MIRLIFAIILFVTTEVTFAKSNIVVLGDSISAGYGLEAGQGWVVLIDKKLQAGSDCCVIINESISGDTSSGGLARIDPILSNHHPKILVIELGANDGLHGLPPALLKKNISEIIHRAQKIDTKVLLLGMKIMPNYGKRYTDMFYQVYPQIAKELDVPIIPFTLEGIALDKDLMQADGLHPNAKAQPLIADKVWHYLKPLLK